MILCIETSGTAGSVALADMGGKCIKLLTADIVNAHAEQISLLVNELMGFALAQGQSVCAVAVNKGPGSYTGLRIGASLAKGLCFGLKIPLLSCDGLELLARQAAISSVECDFYICMLDARRDEVFYAVYSASFDVVEPLGAKVLRDGVWSEYKGKKVVFCGNAVAKMKMLIPAFSDYPEFTETLNATWFCATAARLYQNRILADVAYFEPDYGKAFYTGAFKK
ncbi:MAG: tRNA (adenosine(37)-N6)-threonylcarbamoyltransferase complex dimerization subunit type 1 TsaB [Bacteroidetes bacterium]|nr:tRNA (adenosine(37)-N6)-threonylcarbamoyltransferase complex dimerization subunit type 1 TsaB [Bacteroidota bacterium]